MTAKPFTGISAYACGAWNKETKTRALACYPKDIKRPGIALLWGTWDIAKTVKFAGRFCKRFANRPHLLEVHIANECARRTGRDGGQIAPWLNVAGYNEALINKDKATLDVVKARVNNVLTTIAPVMNEKTRLWLSCGLEDNLKHEAAKVLLQTVKKAVAAWSKQNLVHYQESDGSESIRRAILQPIRIVRNPMTQQPPIGKFFIERHGRNVGGSEVHNFDGIHVGSIDSNAIEDISYTNALAAIKKAKGQYKAMFLWSALAQGWKNQPAQPYEGRTYVISAEEQAGFRMILQGVR